MLMMLAPLASIISFEGIRLLRQSGCRLHAGHSVFVCFAIAFGIYFIMK